MHIQLIQILEREKGERGCIPRAAAELIKLAMVGEDDESNLSITEDRELIGLLEKPISPLCKSHLPIYFVLYPLQHHSPSPHLSLSLLLLVKSTTHF